MVKVLFVCLGNICRSPMAEGLFIHKVAEAGLADQVEIDSCGTGGWHVGEPADARMRQTAAAHGIHLPSRARQLKASDFRNFDYVLAMDASNLRELERVMDETPGGKAQVVKMRSFDEAAPGADVPDPYYGGQGGFEEVYEMLDRSTEALLAHIRQEQRL